MDSSSAQPDDLGVEHTLAQVAQALLQIRAQRLAALHMATKLGLGLGYEDTSQLGFAKAGFEAAAYDDPRDVTPLYAPASVLAARSAAAALMGKQLIAGAAPYVGACQGQGQAADAAMPLHEGQGEDCASDEDAAGMKTEDMAEDADGYGAADAQDLARRSIMGAALLPAAPGHLAAMDAGHGQMHMMPPRSARRDSWQGGDSDEVSLSGMARLLGLGQEERARPYLAWKGLLHLLSLLFEGWLCAGCG